MSWMRFLHRKRSDSELQDEIEAFLTEEAADNEARGLTPDEARRQARLKFGNPQKMRESLWMQNTPYGPETQMQLGSGCRTIVVVQHATEPLAATNRSCGLRV